MDGRATPVVGTTARRADADADGAADAADAAADGAGSGADAAATSGGANGGAEERDSDRGAAGALEVESDAIAFGTARLVRTTAVEIALTTMTPRASGRSDRRAGSGPFFFVER